MQKKRYLPALSVAVTFDTLPLGTILPLTIAAPFAPTPLRSAMLCGSTAGFGILRVTFPFVAVSVFFA